MSKVSKSNNDSEKCYLASVICTRKFIYLYIIDEKTQEHYKIFRFTTVKKILESILKFKSMLKAAFLKIDKIKTLEYKNNYEASKAIRDFMDLHSIPCHFYTCDYSIAFNLMVAANIIPYINDDIFVVNIGTDKMIMGFYRFTINGYKLFGTQEIENATLEFCELFLPKVMVDIRCKKMVLFTMELDDTLIKNLANILRSKEELDFGEKLVVIDYAKLVETELQENSIIEMSKWFFDRSYIKFYVMPLVHRTIKIVSIFGDSQKELITAELGEFMPFIKSVVIEKSAQRCLMLRNNLNDDEIIETLNLHQNCHRQKITLTIDTEYFPKLEIESIIIPEIQDLPKKLDGILKTKIPVIGFFENSSVICVHQNGRYKFLDSWNGVYGNELLINFDQTEPKFGMDAINPNHTKMFHVVYDLIKIMSMPPENITVNKNWKFEITKDSENPVLLEFDNHGGEKSLASPQFLMAMLLKEQIKHIKNEQKNEKPKEIGFCFFDEMTEVELKRIEAGLEESCGMLKLKCQFIGI